MEAIVHCPLDAHAVCPAVYSAHMREKALEALLWFMQLPAARDRPGLVTPSEMVQWMSTGGGGPQPNACNLRFGFRLEDQAPSPASSTCIYELCVSAAVHALLGFITTQHHPYFCKS
jgi:hypothetical protein